MEPTESFWRRLVRKQYFWPLVVATVLIVIAAIICMILDIRENRRIDEEAFTFVAQPSVRFGEEVKVSDFAHPNAGTTLLDDYKINTERLGEVEVSFDYINARNRRRSKSLRVEVVDRTAPKVYGGSLYSVQKGYQGDLTDLMLSGDDVDDSPRREIVGNYDLNQTGHYDLTYTITDASGNQTRYPFTLQVVESTNATYDPYQMPKLPLTEVIREHKTAQTKIGIDVSQWQGEIDWPKVKEAGVEFVMVRVGYQKGYGGEYVLDPYFVENMLGATEVGLPAGAYFYSYADSEEEARAQAKWVMQQLSGFGVQMPVAFDWEDWGNFNQAGMSFRRLNRVAKTFLDAAAEEGAKGMLYSSKVYLERIWEDLGYPVWLAQYYDRVTYAGEYQMWQMSSSGQVPGIEGDVDLDIWYLGE